MGAWQFRECNDIRGTKQGRKEATCCFWVDDIKHSFTISRRKGVVKLELVLKAAGDTNLKMQMIISNAPPFQPRLFPCPLESSALCNHYACYILSPIVHISQVPMGQNHAVSASFFTWRASSLTPASAIYEARLRFSSWHNGRI